MKTKSKEFEFVICIDNVDCPASLEVGKVYRTISDRKATSLGMLRAVDESGEDYLYPKQSFAAIKLPQAVKKALSIAS